MTTKPVDDEMADWFARHRGSGRETRIQPVLVDCLALWPSNNMLAGAGRYRNGDALAAVIARRRGASPC